PTRMRDSLARASRCFAPSVVAVPKSWVSNCCTRRPRRWRERRRRGCALGDLLASGPLAAGSELAGERVTTESKPARGLAAMPMGMLERRFEQHVLELGQRLAVQVGGAVGQARARPAGQRDFPILALPRAFARAHERGVELCGTDGIARRQRDQAPAEVLQLTHVARPVVAL